jgi:hypothetical protein
MVKLTMYKFYNSPNNIYLETDRIKIQKENKSTKQSPKVNINTLLNRVKIEEKKKIKKNFLFLFFGLLAIIFSFFILQI